MELDVSTFDLPAALSNAITLVRERAQRHAIDLALEVDKNLGAFSGDERKFKQIMLNLLSNAVKFTPDGGRVAFLRRRHRRQVEISVQRHRHRHRARGPGGGVRGVQAGRARQVEEGRGHGPWPRAHQALRRAARRRDPPRERAGQGLDLHRLAAAGQWSMESRYRPVLLFGSLVMLIASASATAWPFLQRVGRPRRGARCSRSRSRCRTSSGPGAALSGMLADRFGAGKVARRGAPLRAGLWLMSAWGARAAHLLGWPAHRAGPLGHHVQHCLRRDRAGGSPSAHGAWHRRRAASFGQFVMVPGSQALIGWGGWAFALAVLAAVAFLMAPFSAASWSPHAHPGPQQTLGEAVREARAQRSRLAAGHFTCGFQVVFIGSHLPAYLSTAASRRATG